MVRYKKGIKRDERKKGIRLDYKSFLKLERIRKISPTFNFSQFVCDCLNEKFPKLAEVEFHKFSLIQLEKERVTIEDKMQYNAECIRVIKESEEKNEKRNKI